MNAPETCRWEFDGIGTRWRVDTAEAVDPATRRDILAVVEDYDRALSRFRPDSLVSRVATSDGDTVTFPSYTTGLFDLYDWLYRATGGAVDPLVGRALELLGYDPGYSLTPAPAAVREAEQAAGLPDWGRDVVRDGAAVTTRRRVVIDVGAAGKGYLVDLLTERLRVMGHTGLTVDGSGDLRTTGGLRVGLEHPRRPGTAIGVVELSGQALCASATNRRAWRGLHHVVDPRTGRPVGGVLATWAVADTAAEADGLATALFFTDPDVLAEEFEFSGVVVYDDLHVRVAGDLPGELFR